MFNTLTEITGCSIANIFPSFALVRQDVAGALFGPAKDPLADVLVFKSGASRPADITGYALAGDAIGVVAGEMSENCNRLLREHLLAGGSVFVDSGAYNAFTAGNRIEIEEFDRILTMYEAFARGLADPSRLSVVMPDEIGNQARTFELQRIFRQRIVAMIEAGVQAIVPVQLPTPDDPAPVALPDAFAATVAILGTDRFRLGIPGKHKAFGHQVVRELLAGAVLPQRFHVLGVAADRRKLLGYVEAIRASVPNASITSDGCRIRALVGKRAPLTEGTKRIKAQVGSQIAPMEQILLNSYPDSRLIDILFHRMPDFEGNWPGEDDSERFDITEVWGSASTPGYLTEAQLRFLAAELVREPYAQSAFEYWLEDGFDPTEYVEQIENLQGLLDNSRAIALQAISQAEQDGGRFSRRKAARKHSDAPVAAARAIAPSQLALI